MVDPKASRVASSDDLVTVPTLSEFREATAAKLRTAAASCDDKEDDGLEHLYATTQALIKLNSEIVQRCLPNHVFAAEQKTAPARNCASASAPASATLLTEVCRQFYRVGFDEVKVKSTSSGTVDITTTSILSQKTFKIPTVPEILGDVVPMMPTITQSSSEVALLPEYQRILARASSLHDDILVLFLVIFKGHLKSVQAALGAIESWLLEPLLVIVFLNETFVPKSPLFGAVRQEQLVLRTSKFQFGEIERCVKCALTKDSGLSTYGSPPEKKMFCQCKSGPYYFKSCSHVLRNMTFTEGGSMDHTFRVTEESEQEKLKKLLPFLALFSEDVKKQEPAAPTTTSTTTRRNSNDTPCFSRDD